MQAEAPLYHDEERGFFALSRFGDVLARRPSVADRIFTAAERAAQLREENDLLKKLEPSGLPRKRRSSPSSRSTGGGSK